jgi:hypothetical protein
MKREKVELKKYFFSFFIYTLIVCKFPKEKKMKRIILSIGLIAAIFAGVSCTSMPAPGEPGHRQTYRPLIQHLIKNNPQELKNLKKLKISNPAEYKEQLNALNERYKSVIVRVKGKDGNFTCGCPKCKANMDEPSIPIK